MKTSLDRSAVQSDRRRRGFGLRIWIGAPKGCELVQATDESVLLAEGELELAVAGRTWPPVIGEEILMRSGQRHLRAGGVGTNCWRYGYRTAAEPSRAGTDGQACSAC